MRARHTLMTACENCRPVGAWVPGRGYDATSNKIQEVKLQQRSKVEAIYSGTRNPINHLLLWVDSSIEIWVVPSLASTQCTAPAAWAHWMCCIEGTSLVKLEEGLGILGILGPTSGTFEIYLILDPLDLASNLLMQDYHRKARLPEKQNSLHPKLNSRQGARMEAGGQCARLCGGEV